MFDIPLLINLLSPLIERKNIHEKHQIKEHSCKLDKITYSKRSLEQRITLAKVSIQCIFKGGFCNSSKKLS